MREAWEELEGALIEATGQRSLFLPTDLAREILDFTRLSINGAPIHAGEDFSVALRDDGSLLTWGRATWVRDRAPKGVLFSAIAAGSHHVVGIKSDGSLVTWAAQVGHSHKYDRAKMENSPTGSDFIGVAAGRTHALAIKADGSLVGWGTGGVMNIPSEAGFVAVDAVHDYSVALKYDGSLVTFGDERDRHGMIRDTPTEDRFVSVAGSCHYRHFVGLKSDGSLACWGNDDYRAVSATPTGTGFEAAVAGSVHCVALKTDGTLLTWGGKDNPDVLRTPTGDGFVAVAAGHVHSLALKSDGTLVSWGYTRNVADPPNISDRD